MLPEETALDDELELELFDTSEDKAKVNVN
jgi:hypothetical protein